MLIIITTDFSSEMMKAISKQNNFQVLKGKYVKTSFKIKGERKSFSDKQKMGECVSKRHSLCLKKIQVTRC